MITDNNKKLAQWAMDFALKNGCQAAKVVLYANSNTSFELRDAKMDRLQQASESGMGINVYVDGRYGNYSTNRLDKKGLIVSKYSFYLRSEWINPAQNELRPGKYRLNTTMNYDQIINQLTMSD